MNCMTLMVLTIVATVALPTVLGLKGVFDEGGAFDRWRDRRKEKKDG